jgi:hypothetical protein
LIILILVVGLILIAGITALQGKLAGGARRQESLTSVLGQLTPTGSYELNVVGEASYQSNIERIAGGRTSEGVRSHCEATLVPEDGNTHDPMAVRVDIQGKTVGYLSRPNAREYRAEIKRLGFPNGIFSCKALIVGGWERGTHDRGHFGVKLDVPVNG